MGGKIPKNIKEKVIHQWLQGLTRERIAKENDIGAGTVTAIIKEAGEQKEYYDIELLRHVATILKEERLELAQLGFAIRLKKIMEENGISEDQLESIILEFATYCFKHNLPFDKLIDSGYEALNLAYKFGISVEKIPEYIVRGKKIIQELIRKKQRIQEEYITIVAELEKYRKDKPLIEHIKELERELNETKKYYEARTGRLEQQLANARHDVTTMDNQRREYLHALSQCQEKLEELKKSIKWSADNIPKMP